MAKFSIFGPKIGILLLIGVIGCLSATGLHHDDEFRKGILEGSYHGLVKENETLVELMPVLRVDDTKVCGFHIRRRSKGEILPFQIELQGGIGQIRAIRTLNCEKRKNYKFEVVAMFCDPMENGGAKYSKPAQIRITVVDVNEYAPTFLQPSYSVQVDEGRLYKEVVRLEAVDKDCTPLYGDVCKFEIEGQDGASLFAIDDEGAIRNLQPLSYKKAHNHILSVIAYDCAMKPSAPVMVNIKVNRVCEARLIGVPERIDYVANNADENVVLFPNIALELCDLLVSNSSRSVFAPKYEVEAEVELKTNHISYGCDRDNLVARCDLMEQKAGGNGQFVDLLARDRDWTKELNYDEVVKGDGKAKSDEEMIYHFDGTVGAVVPNAAVSDFDFSNVDSQGKPNGIKFSILTMFRHRNNLQTGKNVDVIKRQKEHLLCTADNHKMNRHHMALFVRNCRLIFLLRRNSHAPQMNIFAPAEWRWKIPQVCDNEWHTYVVNVNSIGNNSNLDDGTGGIQVELFVDGEGVKDLSALEDDQDDVDPEHHKMNVNPEVIDDWPLHAAHGVGTTLTIGACYQGTESSMKHFFNGDMAQLKLALNYNFDKTQIQCGLDCREFLQVNGIDEMHHEKGAVRTTLNRQRNLVKIEAATPHLAEKILRSIQYTNRKQNPTIGRRNLIIRTKIQLNKQDSSEEEDEDNYHQLPSMDSYIMVSNSAGEAYKMGDLYKKFWPRIQIEGKENHPVSYLDIKTGVKIMDNLKITVKTNAEETESGEDLKTANFKSGIVMVKSEKNKSEKNKSDLKWSENNNVNSVMDEDETEEEDSEEDLGDDKLSPRRLQYLDNCQLTIFPNLNTDHEEIKFLFLNQTTPRQKGKESDNSEDQAGVPSTKTSSFFYNDINVELSVTGLRLTGYDTTANYRFILKNLLYINRKPAYYLNRIFKLKCSQLDGRLESNEFQLTLTVLHPKQTPSPNTPSAATRPEEEAVAASKVEAAVFSHSMIHRGAVDESPSKLRQVSEEGGPASSNHNHSHAHLLILAICACFVLIIGGVGVARLRNRIQLKTKGQLQRGQKKAINAGNVEGGGDFKLLAQDELELMEGEEDLDGKHHPSINQLDWDDTPLTITVNPMQNWTDEDEENGIEYLMAAAHNSSGGKKKGLKRGVIPKSGPTLQLSELAEGSMVVQEEEEEEEELEDDDEDEDSSSDEEVDSDEEEESDDDLEDDEDVENRFRNSSNNSSSGSNKKGSSSKKNNVEQLEWDNSTM